MEPVMEPNAEFHRVSISPVGLLKQSLALMGDQYWLFVGISFVALMIASLVPLGILMGPMMCGIYLCFFLRMKGQEASFETLFKGFDYFVESLIATLIITLISFLAMIPLIGVVIAVAVGAAAAASGAGESGVLLAGPLIVLSYLGILVLSLVITICFVFVYPLIVDRQMRAIPALKTSARAAMANFLGILQLFLLEGVIFLLAACACYLPVFLFAPIAIGATALLYRDVFSK